ncbi:MAG TPA: hypothetical protein VKB80_25830 [Kofleriaceae bacterium]|nr:hypothetical protein [Kofleriaceae bacterium]
MHASTARPRVLCILWHYPQLSEQYMETELRALSRDHELCVVSLHETESYLVSYREHLPFHVARNFGALAELADEFRPDVLHGHWLMVLPVLHQLARARGVPFTLRAHSFDTIHEADVGGLEGRWHARSREVLPVTTRDELCLGMLAFPFSRRYLEERGVPPDKIHDCLPVVDVERFLDRGPNGADVMSVGPCLPKKRMEDVLDLALRVPSRRFRLYAIGYGRLELAETALEVGAPVELSDPIEPSGMPSEYKRHAWMVATGCPERRTLGWSVSIAEAQAAGVGVIAARLRPDQADYLDGAGFLYTDLEEAARLVRGPVPDEVRERGFAVAQRSDVWAHLHRLTDLWMPAGLSAARSTRRPIERSTPAG